MASCVGNRSAKQLVEETTEVLVRAFQRLREGLLLTYFFNSH
jgi:hypothetical protein